MKELKTAIIGAGFIGKQHIEALRRIPGTRITAIADVNEEMGRQVMKKMCIPSCYQDYREMLLKERPDVIHNCTPSSLHYEVNKEVILSGTHIYCEKPLTLTGEEAGELTRLAAQKGVAAGVNFNYRNNVMVHEMKERIRQDAIGTPFMVYGEYLQDWLLYETDYDWRMDPALGGESRAIADIGSHCFDTAQYVLGKEIKAVYARLINLYPVRKKSLKKTETFSEAEGTQYEKVPVPSEDAAFIMAEFEDKSQALFHVTQVCAGSKNGLALTVSGKKASLRWEQERPDHLLVGYREKGNEDIYAGAQYLTDYAKPFATLPNGHPVGWADAFTNGIGSFYRHIQNPELPYVHADFSDGWKIMKIVEACLKSSRENRWIEIG